jgi:ribonuclease G
MAAEILLNVTARETRVALLENRHLQEIHIERNSQRSASGNFYKGKIVRLLPGLQAAFVDIGLTRSAFLHLSDIHQTIEQDDIRKVLHPGQEILVQVYKDPLGSKGARLTTQFTIPARYLVLTPYVADIVISQKITAPEIREKLLNMITPDAQSGYIFRTVAVDATPAEFAADQKYLANVWSDIETQSRAAKVGELVYEEIPLLLRVLRDIAHAETETIWVDNQDAMNMLQTFAKKYVPRLVDKIQYYADSGPIFDRHAVEEQLQNALERKVELKSGGHLVFDQTEAMITIDVNTGSYSGQATLGQMARKINLAAAEVIATQLRLRNLGGIIIIDFVDMNNPEHKAELLQVLNRALAKDSVRTEVSELTSLGLVQMTRKRVRESLEHILCVSCPLCQRRGSIKSLETLSYAIIREVKRNARTFTWPGFLVLAAKVVIDYLQTQEADLLKALEAELGKPLRLQVESSYGQEHYDVLPLDEA